MRRIVAATCVVAFLVVVSPVRADDDDAAKLKAVINKAIKAHGGAEKLKKMRAFVAKSKGKYYGMGDGIEYEQEMSMQFPNRQRTYVEAGDFKFTQVVNGDKGWRKLGDNTEELSKEQLDEVKENLYAATVAHLAVLTDKAYELSSLGEGKVGDTPVVGVRVKHKGHRDVSLFFDKKDHLLLKSETRGKDTMGDGGEFTAVMLYKDYKKVDGLMTAHKIVINHDGKLFVEAEITEFKYSEKLDDNVFDKP
jgi:hypothetical protein